MSITSRERLQHYLKSYSTPYPEEAPFAEKFLSLLQAEAAYRRDHLPGHITGSAWILNSSKNQVLLVHHAKLNKWLQPGGHADGDENILQVAIREAREETGLNNLTLLHSGLFDIDIHTIPQRKEVPEHLHYDIRFAFQTDGQEEIMRSEESHNVAWINVDDLAQQTQSNTSILRMVKKSANLS